MRSRKPRKKAKVYRSQYRDRYGLSLVEMGELMSWSYGTVYNVINKPGYEVELKELNKAIKSWKRNLLDRGR